MQSFGCIIASRDNLRKWISGVFRSLSVSANLTVLAILIFTLFAACETSERIRSRMTTEPVISGSKLLPAERVAIFEEVWGTINNRYYDANFHGVNWRESHDRYRPRMVAAANDVEFYALFEVMLAELRDAHTLFTRPPAVADAPGEPKRSVGFWLGQAEHKTIIVAVEPDSDAARAGVLPGMVLRAVNNRPLDQIYAEIRLQLAGSSSERA